MSKFGSLDPYAFYDEWGNRYIFFTLRELQTFERNKELIELLKNR